MARSGPCPISVRQFWECVMKRISVLFGVGLAVLASGAALADDLAYTRSSATLRSEPRSRSRVVASLSRDTEVHVRDCHDGWCYSRVGDRSGYVSASLLDFDGDTGATVVERTYVEPEYVYPGPYYAGPGFYFGCCGPSWHRGPGWHDGWHHWRR